MKFVGLMKGHFTAFEDKTVFVSGADHFAFVDIHHLPKVVLLTFVGKAFGKLHIENRNDFFYIDYFFKRLTCKIIPHKNTPLSKITSIIPDFALLCKRKLGIIILEYL